MKELIACRYAPIIKNNDVLSVIGSIFWPWAEADRFDILNEKSPYNFIIDPTKELPKHNPPKETMEELCVIKAKEVVEANPNKQILVFWSGGVDSTAIVCSFILANIKKEQLVVCYTEKSIEENPKFYEWLLHNNYTMIKYRWIALEKLFDKYSDAKFCIGWCADQLFGSIVNQTYPDLYTVPYEDGLKAILQFRHQYTDIVIDSCIQEWGEYANKINIPIKYTCDALWLFNFGVKWSHLCRDLQLIIKNEKQRQNVFCFFEDIRFQEWALASYQNFHLDNQYYADRYKIPLKNVIFKVNKDEEYYKNKGKVGSWSYSGSTNIGYNTLGMLGSKGYSYYDLTIETEESKKYLGIYTKRNANLINILCDYMKDWVDKDKIMSQINNSRFYIIKEG